MTEVSEYYDEGYIIQPKNPNRKTKAYVWTCFKT